MQTFIDNYCSCGWRIFPVSIYLKDGKVVKQPLIEGWIYKATNDVKEATKLFSPFIIRSDVMVHVGVATGKGYGITVVDIDLKGNKNGYKVLENTIDIQTVLHTARQITPTGGQHLFFKYTDQLKNSVSILDGIDIRNDGGFIVIAPSKFPDGCEYEWIMGQEPWECSLLDIPYELLNVLKPKPKESTGPRQVPTLIKDGERNDKMFKEACSMRERGYTEEEILAGLRTFNKTRCEKPLDDSELLLITKSAGKFEKGEPKAKKKAKQVLYTLLTIMAKDEATSKLFGYNDFTDDIEFFKAPPWNPLQAVGSIITDTDMISLKVYLSAKYGFEPPTGIISEAISYEAQNLRYHPVRDFIKTLKWDGKERLDRWLIHGAGVEDNPYTRAVGRKVLVGAVSRVFQPGCMFQYMLVLEGDQGIGKSRLVSILGGKWFTELNITEEDKDVVEYMRGRWIIEVPEMVCARKTEVDHLKAFITKTKDRVRLAYRRNATDFPRQSILIGTINPSGDNTYLRDDTGGRRFWPVMCTAINVPWLQQVRDQLIAEAYEVYKSGTEELHLTDPEVQRIAKLHQEDRQSIDAWIQHIQEKIENMAPGASFTMSWIAQEALGIKPDKLDRTTQTRIGVILRKLGIPSKRSGHGNVTNYYPIKQVNNAEKEPENNW